MTYPASFSRTSITLALAVLGGAEALLAGAPPRPRGDGKQAPEVTVGNQTVPRVAATASGDFVVVWQGDLAPSVQGAQQAVFFRSFAGRDADPDSGELLVDVPALNVQVAIDDDKNAFLVWEAGDGNGVGLRGRRCREDSCGAVFPINTTTVGNQLGAAVASTRTGGFLVVWQSVGQDTDESQAIVGRFFPPLPSPPTNEFIVNANAAGLQHSAQAAFSPLTQRFTVVWSGPTGAGPGIVARVFDPADGPQGNDVVIVPAKASEPALAIEPGGLGQHHFVWRGFDNDGSGIFARRFNSTLTLASNAFPVNQVVAGDQHSPAVTADADAGATYVWISTTPLPPSANVVLGSPIFLRGVKGTGATGAPLTNSSELVTGGLPPAHFSFEFEVAAAPGIVSPDISGDARGNFVVTWQQDGDFDMDAFYRRYGALIFEDGFEFGNTAAWSNTVP